LAEFIEEYKGRHIWKVKFPSLTKKGYVTRFVVEETGVSRGSLDKLKAYLDYLDKTRAILHKRVPPEILEAMKKKRKKRRFSFKNFLRRIKYIALYLGRKT